jgi:hypothetical protein
MTPYARLGNTGFLLLAGLGLLLGFKPIKPKPGRSIS